ncbi:MAG TPA: hypothetical protein VFO93_21775 [Hymenobacter sp.]|uniref:M949_RS01915 family surface polysaccharide biosynthesis protein n=1 Tax=Hymenobacter sp. TaxID=1898978 RepID=UPI002D7F268B|nr:hypothetical protein [Hymenobacter sp.]HET9506184.1 hypothetical protein [Hymenobacter sp.]
MPSYKYLLCVLALAACSEKQPAASAPKAPAGPAAPAASPAGRPLARQPLKLAQLPAALRPAGELLEAWRWHDANGENLLVAARTSRPAPPADEDAGRTAQLLVRQYVRHGSSYQQLWQLQDAVADCPLDLTLGLLPGSTSITDLDGNGRTETTVLYALACRGGVDPAALKLIMHEGPAKYALRGSTLLLLGGPAELARAKRRAAGPVCCLDSLPPRQRADDAQAEGLYQNEQDFAAAPPAFRVFARQQWRRWRTHDGPEVLP